MAYICSTTSNIVSVAITNIKDNSNRANFDKSVGLADILVITNFLLKSTQKVSTNIGYFSLKNCFLQLAKDLQ